MKKYLKSTKESAMMYKKNIKVQNESGRYVHSYLCIAE